MINPVIILQKELKKLQEFAEDNKKNFSNEEITKQTLILPFIKILGYDTKNPNEVKAEHSPENASNMLKVDYCINANGRDCIYVEAKPYGKNISRDIDQMKRYYDNSVCVEYGLLTNGTDYYFFTGLKESDKMYPYPFFSFNLMDYSIDDIETLTIFMKNKYNNRDMRLIARENRLINKMYKGIYELLGNPDEIKDFLADEFKGMEDEDFSRLISVAVERAIIKKGDEYEEERKQQVVLKYSENQLLSLGRFKYIEPLNHEIFIPDRSKFEMILQTSKDDYCVEKGNPTSDFFVSAIYTDNKNIKGFLIGHFLGELDENDEEDISLYCTPANDIAPFVKNNPIVNENGFINARFLKRTSRKNQSISYSLQSSISGVSFKNFPKLVVEMNNFDEFYEEFFSK
ncbi:hypothetical protein SAMN02745945_01788 [Peptoclostridium litorale DSM 5388]|uniref:Type I restriction enzyme R protein N-terminal domain-containing protein n=1 Tax=Peptoclostridium litorale DSM 5388 TaxID=1121324 RepID=A0A069RFX2_PEPLI|nr:type I restriction enzyme HsdR N-terminal domain-containing protein [Peptoclostridium litorale]KDR95939.1 hypothetical protein CLIT_8c01080 [Peptoclostridium litorale DSM 5388]SIO09583.1 hypothetical protein SAMN02745945_01788 [Peptoclostridium litorale DSM 5388]